MYSAETIANWFLSNIDRESGDSITHLKLQKLLYYAQAWYMVLTENESEPILFEEKIEAWTHGPVVREVYNKYSEMRYNRIPSPNDNVVLDEGEALDILKKYKDENKRFDSIFIGGSGGNLEEIIMLSNELIQNEGTIVMNFITLDNAYKAIETVKKLNYAVDISQVNISKNRGQSYMMIANNPIYIVQCVRSVK